MSLVIDQLGFENSSVPNAAITESGSGYDPDSNIPVTFNPPRQRNHEVRIDDGGSGYKPNDAVAASSIISESVTGVSILNSGSGFPKNQTNIQVTFSPSPTGDTATGQATADAEGRISSIQVTHGGSGYLDPPDVVIGPLVAVTFGVSPTGDTTEGYATTNVQGQIEKIEITNLGSGYESVPVVTIEAPPAKAEAVSVLQNGVVTGAGLTEFGSGYTPGATNIPVAFSSSPTGKTATGRAIADTEGKISSIKIINEGSGYVDSPSVFITLPQQAIAEVKRTELTMEASGGTLPDFNTPDSNLTEITGVKKSQFPLLERGMDVSGTGVPDGTTLIGLSGPDENQTVTLSTSLEPIAVFPFGFRIVESVEVLNAGYSYTEESSNIGVVFSTSPTGDTATGKAISNADGKIIEVEVTYPGSGYGINAPTIKILAPAVTRARAEVQDNVAMGFATANNDGEIKSITITEPGSGYEATVPVVGSSISNDTVDRM